MIQSVDASYDDCFLNQFLDIRKVNTNFICINNKIYNLDRNNFKLHVTRDIMLDNKISINNIIKNEVEYILEKEFLNFIEHNSISTRLAFYRNLNKFVIKNNALNTTYNMRYSFKAKNIYLISCIKNFIQNFDVIDDTSMFIIIHYNILQYFKHMSEFEFAKTADEFEFPIKLIGNLNLLKTKIKIFLGNMDNNIIYLGKFNKNNLMLFYNSIQIYENNSPIYKETQVGIETIHKIIKLDENYKFYKIILNI